MMASFVDGSSSYHVTCLPHSVTAYPLQRLMPQPDSWGFDLGYVVRVALRIRAAADLAF
jgi:hypothetical protein